MTKKLQTTENAPVYQGEPKRVDAVDMNRKIEEYTKTIEEYKETRRKLEKEYQRLEIEERALSHTIQTLQDLLA